MANVSQYIGFPLLNGDKGDLSVSNSGSTWSIKNSAVSYSKIQNVSTTDRLLGRSSSGAGVVEEIICTPFARTLLEDSSAEEVRTTLGVSVDYTVTTTPINKTLVNRERCTVISGGLTINLPASPSPGWEVTISIGGDYTNTVIGRNGSNLMSLTEDLLVDKAYVSVTLYYVDSTRGWRII